MTVVGIPIIKQAAVVRAWALSWPETRTRNSLSYFITWSNDTYTVSSGLGVLTATATWNYTGFAFPSLGAYMASGTVIPEDQLDAANPRAAQWAYPDGYNSSGKIGDPSGAHSPETFTWSAIPQSVLDTYAGSYLTIGGMVGNPLRIDIIAP